MCHTYPKKRKSNASLNTLHTVAAMHAAIIYIHVASFPNSFTSTHNEIFLNLDGDIMHYLDFLRNPL